MTTKAQLKDNFIPEVQQMLEDFDIDHPQQTPAFRYGRLAATFLAIHDAYHYRPGTARRAGAVDNKYLTLGYNPMSFPLAMARATQHLSGLHRRGSSKWWETVLSRVQPNFTSLPRTWTMVQRGEVALGFMKQRSLNKDIIARAPSRAVVGGHNDDGPEESVDTND